MAGYDNREGKVKKMTATIFDIQRNSFVDGPGIRTTVFFKGCNLRCAWCHSPESQNFQKEMLFYKNKCVGCGNCEGVSVDNADFCCLYNAKEICGKEYTPQEVFEIICKDKLFYDTSGGGVTFSGGECMLQIDFLCEILKKCKENGIHTAVDTAGNVCWESFEKILPYTDLFLYDIKVMNEEKHKEYTGVKNDLILENLKKLLEADIPVWVRIPVVCGVNDSEEEMKRIGDFFEKNGYPQKIELLPYHAMGDGKYQALGRKAQEFDTPKSEKIEKLKYIFSRNETTK